MKRLHHNLFSIRGLCFLMASLCLWFCLFSFSVSAEEADSESEARTEAVEWVVTEDGLTLSSGYDVYTYHEMPIGYRLEPHNIFTYMNVAHINGLYQTLYSHSPDGGMLWDDQDRIYLTEEAERELTRFLSGDVSCYRLENREKNLEVLLSAELTEALFAASKAGDTTETVDVTDLYGQTCYEIVAYDSTDTVCTAYGAVYKIHGKLYYLHYQTLGNEHFTADGEFSYRSGSVELVLLDDSLSTEVSDAVKELSRRNQTITYEEELLVEKASMEAFWICFVFCGFLLPIAPLTVGLVLPHSAKRGYPRFWYLLAAAAVLWMLFAAILTAVLIFT